MSFPIGQWWKDRDRNHLITDDHLPKYCDGCPFIAPVCHGGEDGCSVFSNYGDVCHVTEGEKATVREIVERAGREHGEDQ